MYPDGGVARLRVHGEGRPDRRVPRLGPLDLAALENGGLVLDCSNRFYCSPQNLLFPGSAARDGRRLGDRTPSRRRQRLGANPVGGPWHRPDGRGRHLVLSSATVPAPRIVTGSDRRRRMGRVVAAHRAASPTPGTASRRLVDEPRVRRPGWTSTRTAAWPGSRLVAASCAMTDYPRDMVGYGRTPPDPQWPGARGSPSSSCSITKRAARTRARRGPGIGDLPVGDHAGRAVPEPAHEHGVAVRVRLAGRIVAGVARLRATRTAVDHFRGGAGDAAQSRRQWRRSANSATKSPATDCGGCPISSSTATPSARTWPRRWRFCTELTGSGAARLVHRAATHRTPASWWSSTAASSTTPTPTPTICRTGCGCVGADHLVVPYTLDTNDMRFASPAGFSNGDEFFAHLRDAFDVLYAEGSDGSPKMLSVGCTAGWSAAPHGPRRWSASSTTCSRTTGCGSPGGSRSPSTGKPSTRPESRTC